MSLGPDPEEKSTPQPSARTQCSHLMTMSPLALSMGHLGWTLLLATLVPLNTNLTLPSPSPTTWERTVINLHDLGGYLGTQVDFIHVQQGIPGRGHISPTCTPPSVRLLHRVLAPGRCGHKAPSSAGNVAWVVPSHSFTLGVYYAR